MHKTAWLIGASLASSVVLAQVAPNQTAYEIVSSGVERFYLLHVPAGYDGEAVPLVLDFHGSGGVPENQSRTSNFGMIADREGFAVAFPAGVFTNSGTVRSWNANAEGGVDDVQFARDVIDDVAERLSVDRSRIYTTGFSGGARMSSRLACELSDLLAAAAPVAGLQYPDDCTLGRPMPVLAIHGTADRVNRYELAENSHPYWRMGVETAVEKWRNANSCDIRSDATHFSDDVDRRTWTDCSADSEIAFYVIEGGRHVWPDFASEVIWGFFSRHRL